MSDTTEETFVRRPRGERPQREVHREPPTIDIQVDDGGSGDISPHEALEASRQALEEANRRAAEAQQARRVAEQQAAAAQANRATDRQAVLQSAITSADSDITAAKAAYRAAREAGDFDAETEANAAMADATARRQQAAAELAWTKQQQPQQAPPPQQQQANRPSPEAQAWLDAHPAYFADDEYQAMANVAHNRAIAAGKANGSQEYVNWVDNFLTAKYGEGHGQIGKKHEPMNNNPPPRQRGNGGEVPTTRRATSASGAFKTAPIGQGKGYSGDIQYQETGNGGRRIKMTPAMMETCKEFASINGMSVEDYVNDQIDHHEAGGGDIVYGDGSRHE